MGLSRRDFAKLTAGLAASLGTGLAPSPADAAAPFDRWVTSFHARARARGISDATYAKVMTGLKPDTSVYALDKSQPEFNEETWQYLNRRVSDWRIITGKERVREFGPLLTRIEQDYGVDRFTLAGLWGMESAFGEVVVNPRHMRPVFPALAALAWGEPRRRAYWEKELLNALVIVERGWSTPQEMNGSWAGAMGHTQWMPEVWLNMGVDYNRDGRISPFGTPDDALAGTARYLVSRGKYRRGEPWGYEVRVPGGKVPGGSRTMSAWAALGVKAADGRAFAVPAQTARLWQPDEGGPVFLLGQNFYAVRSYNPSMNYTLAIVHLGDRIRGLQAFAQQWPGGERAPTHAEIQEIQKRLTALGFDTGGTDGRVGRDTMVAVRGFQRRVGMEPADGYPGVKLLGRLRQGL